MITHYCPECWSTLQGTEITCPNCGFLLQKYNQLAFEEKLLVALHHPVPERRIMAAQILGNLHSQQAISEFENIIAVENDYFFLRAVLLAVAKIKHPRQMDILSSATRHPSSLVAHLALELQQKLRESQPIDEWDHNTT